MSRAIGLLRKQGRLAPKPRPNQPARELRYEREHSTPEQRVRAAVALSQTAHALAGRGAQARRKELA